MKRRAVVTLGLGLCAGIATARGQREYTASRGLGISAFGGVAGSYTGLSGGRNLGITAGIDLSIRAFYGLTPALEIRGLYPVDGGLVDSQKNGLGGLRVARQRGAFQAYGDILFGRGEINYENGGYLNVAGTFRYVDTTSNVISPGAGVSYDLPRNLGVFADVQFQRYDTPVTVSGTIWAKAVSVGAVYRFPATHRGRPYP